MLLPRLWRPLPLRYSARAASELCASAPGPPVCVGLCSCRHACDSARWSSQAPDRAVRPGGGLRSEALHGPLKSLPASRAHGVHHSFSDLSPFVFRDPPPYSARFNLTRDDRLPAVLDLGDVLVLDYDSLLAI